ncbi:uncharacterized protein LOC132205079 [Neocloeon triangulifer]|uniref:uncharacterized protein LOC132205079 n=1 Tax=Neocloeon triangulifer TaxID=2078957 RepID=UPI00286EDE74|nr:uncharacterized protein LOC132205079 [Neocloeon triangulifer]
MLCGLHFSLDLDTNQLALAAGYFKLLWQTPMLILFMLTKCILSNNDIIHQKLVEGFGERNLVNLETTLTVFVWNCIWSIFTLFLMIYGVRKLQRWLMIPWFCWLVSSTLGSIGFYIIFIYFAYDTALTTSASDIYATLLFTLYHVILIVIDLCLARIVYASFGEIGRITSETPRNLVNAQPETEL